MRSALAWAASLIVGLGVVVGIDQGDQRQAIPHGNIFGSEIDDSVCSTYDRDADLQKVIKGDSLPYAYVGPAQDCDAWGCRIDYWMSRCRWDAQNEPACPLEARQSLIARLSLQAQKGSKWVEDAFKVKPCDLWPLIRGRSVWVIGDSLSQDIALNLVCFMAEYMAPDGRSISDDAEILQRLTTSPSGKEMRAWCIHFEGETRICSLRANKVPRLVNIVLEAMTSIADPESDIAVLNIGAWYNYVEDGMGELQRDMIKFEVGFNKLRNSLPKRIIWREATAQHFNTTTGMFDHQVSIGDQRCAPAGSKLGVQLGLDSDRNLVHGPHSLNETWELDVMLKGGHRNTAMQPVIDRLGIATLRIWNVSLVLHDFHNNYHRPDSGGHCVWVECDCSHACSPSWYPLMLADFITLLQRDWDGVSAALSSGPGYNRTLVTEAV